MTETRPVLEFEGLRLYHYQYVAKISKSMIKLIEEINFSRDNHVHNLK